MALATTDVSLTASSWPKPPGPPRPPVLPVPVPADAPGVAAAFGVGDAAVALRGPRIVAPATPPTSSDPTTIALVLSRSLLPPPRRAPGDAPSSIAGCAISSDTLSWSFIVSPVMPAWPPGGRDVARPLARFGVPDRTLAVPACRSGYGTKPGRAGLYGWCAAQAATASAAVRSATGAAPVAHSPGR